MYPNTRRNARRQKIGLWLYRRFKRKGLGHPIDPISWDEIPKEFLFCHDQPNGIILLHDCRTLYAYLKTQDRHYPHREPTNPLTRVPLDLASLWHLESLASKEEDLVSLSASGERSHLKWIERHLSNQTLRHKTVALRKFVRTVRKTVKDLIRWSNEREGDEEGKIDDLRGVLEAFLESLYATETSIAKDVVQCIARELRGWPKDDLAWLHATAMDFRQTYKHRDILSSMCMDRRISAPAFKNLLSGMRS